MTNFQLIHIGILRYPGAQEATILGLKDLFTTANQLAKKLVEQRLPDLKVSIIDLEGKINYTDITFLRPYYKEKNFSALIIPPDLNGVPIITEDRLYINFLQSQYQKGTILASVCTGAFLLGAAGLLSQRSVTTHWKYADILQKYFPDIYLNIDQMLINHKDIITASGGMAWGDLGLCLIERLLGPVAMLETSKMCLLQPSGREQRHYNIFDPCFNHGDLEILKVQQWIEHIKIKEAITLKKISKIAKLKIRTLQRRFVKATGLNITEYLQRYRISKSQDFLQFTQMPIEQVAYNVGYKDCNAFSRVFIKIVGLSPNIYRQMFLVAQ